jgi:hypothetical protein
MSDPERLPSSARELLANYLPDPAPEVEERVLMRLRASIAALPPPAEVSAPVGPVRRWFGSWGLPIAAVSLAVGVGLGVAYERRSAASTTAAVDRARSAGRGPDVDRASAAGAPLVIDPGPQAEAPTPSPGIAEQELPRKPAPPTVSKKAPAEPSPPPEAPRSKDVALADERHRVELARQALLRKDAATAISWLEVHADHFGDGGQLAEEREAIWIQALIASGEVARARQKADAFERRYPDSFLLPAVRAAMASVVDDSRDNAAVKPEVRE